MNMKRLPLVLIMLLMIVFFNNSEVFAFSDLKGHWSSDYVKELSSKNIISGYKDGTFKPDNSITKAEFFKLINSMASFNKTYAVSFADVKKTDWYYDEVAKGIKAGYITPTTGNLYPNRPITREEAIWIIGYVYKMEENEKPTVDFNDRASIDETYLGYIGALVGKKIVSGFPDGNFYPKRELTRGEVSKVLSSCINSFGNPQNKFLVDSEIKFGPRGLYE